MNNLCDSQQNSINGKKNEIKLIQVELCLIAS